MKKHLGKFSVPMSEIENLSIWPLLFYLNFIPLEVHETNGFYHYTGYSEKFRELKDNEPVPAYSIICSKERGKAMKIKIREVK